MGYAYEIFLSYPRGGAVGRWVKDVFKPELELALADECSSFRVLQPGEKPGPRIFFDEEMDNGGVLSARLKHGLRASRCMICLWTAQYFESGWCDAEWRSMYQRERDFQLGVDGPGLVYPIRCGGNREDHNGPAAKDILCKHDFRQFTRLRQGQIGLQRWLQMSDAIAEVCTDMQTWLGRTPDWQADFPLVSGSPLTQASLNPASLAKPAQP